MMTWLKRTLLAISMTTVFSNGAVGDTINLGDPDSEKVHDVSARDAETVSETYPDRMIMAARASAYDEGHEPYRVVDGDSKTNWEVAGEPPEPTEIHWIELVLNRDTEINEVKIEWLGDESYTFRIIAQHGDDATDITEVYRGESAAQVEEYRFDETVEARSLRIEIMPNTTESPRGIKELLIGSLSWPEAYPLAAYPDAPVAKVDTRPVFIDSERTEMKLWEQFNFKRPLADGGNARRIMNTDEFEGGYIDFDIAVHPHKQNWITLKIWECETDLMTDRNNLIALEIYADDPDKSKRWLVPDFMTDFQIEPKKWNHEWYNLKQPGRWVYAHYALHHDVTRGREQVRLRLQGIGNKSRDYPMKAPAPPVYTIRSHTGDAALPNTGQ